MRSHFGTFEKRDPDSGELCRVEVEPNSTTALKKCHALSVGKKNECYTEKTYVPRKKKTVHGGVIIKQSCLYQIAADPPAKAK